MEEEWKNGRGSTGRNEKVRGRKGEGMGRKGEGMGRKGKEGRR